MKPAGKSFSVIVAAERSGVGVAVGGVVGVLVGVVVRVAVAVDVAVGGTVVAVGGMGVVVDGIGVADGGPAVAVDGRGVGVAAGDAHALVNKARVKAVVIRKKLQAFITDSLLAIFWNSGF